MAMRDLVTGGAACAVPGTASSSNPFGALAKAILGSSSKAQVPSRGWNLESLFRNLFDCFFFKDQIDQDHWILKISCIFFENSRAPLDVV